MDLDGLSELALSAPPGADGLVVVPYLEGERTPNRPDATGAVHGWQLATSTPAHLARAAVEGMLCGLADGLDALVAAGRDGRARPADRWGRALRSRAPDRPEHPRPCRRRARARGVRRRRRGPPGGLGAVRCHRPAGWTASGTKTYEADPAPAVRARYAEVRDLTASRPR